MEYSIINGSDSFFNDLLVTQYAMGMIIAAQKDLLSAH
jgi:hypothetical protein